MPKKKSARDQALESLQAHGLSLREAARQIGVDPGRLSRILSGHARADGYATRPTLAEAVAIRDLLGVPVDDWLDDTSSSRIRTLSKKKCRQLPKEPIKQ